MFLYVSKRHILSRVLLDSMTRYVFRLIRPFVNPSSLAFWYSVAMYTALLSSH